MTCSQFLNHFQVVSKEHYSQKRKLSENQLLNSYILGDRMPNEKKHEKQDFFSKNTGFVLFCLLLDLPVVSSCVALGNLGFVHYFQ